MRVFIGIIAVIAMIVGGVLVLPAHLNAQCEGEPATNGDDTIRCTEENSNDFEVVGEDGDDTIIIEEGAEGVEGLLYVVGDNIEGDGFGNDTITNNGEVFDIIGDSGGASGYGDDVITNNGTVEFDIYGDTDLNGTDSDGNDIITNNGEVDGNITANGGNDLVVNNGTVENNIHGDDENGSGDGNDIILNSGLVEGTIYGDSAGGAGTGNDTIVNSGTVSGGIEAGGGDDSVILSNFGTVGGLVNGDAGFDTLEFDITTANTGQLLEWADQIFAASPSGGTLSFNGVTYTWANFEELVQLLNLTAVNGPAIVMQGYCIPDGSFDVYRIVSATEGVFAFRATAQQISAAFVDITENRLVASDGDLQLWALTNGELQMNAPGYEFAFDYADYCGILPEATIFFQQEPEDLDELPPFTVVNRPLQ